MGNLHEGVLVLDRPVLEYCPWKYDRLYSIRVGSDDGLISQAAIRTVMENRNSSQECIDWMNKLIFVRP